MAQELGINIGEAQGTTRYVRYDRGIRAAVKQRVRSVSYGGTYEERVPDGINIIEEIYTATFSNRSYAEISDLIDFFDSKNGVESFLLYVKDTSNTEGARGVPVVCEKYNVTYVNKKVASLACTFQKIVTTQFNDDEIYQDLTEFSQGQYTLLSNKAEAVAGETITFTLLSLNVPDGSYVAFDISGVTEYTVEGDYTDFVIVGNQGSITITIDDPLIVALPAVLTFTLTDFPSASIDIDIFALELTAPTLTFSTQSPTNQSVVFHLKSDGTYGLSDSLVGDFIYNQEGTWINNNLGLNSSEFEVYFESTIDDPSITVVSDPVTAISQYVDFNQDITVTFTASLADNVGPNSEAFNLNIREKADVLNIDTGVITAQLEGASVPVPTYALSLRNIIEGTSNSLYEGETVVLDFISNQVDTDFNWSLVAGSATLNDYNIAAISGTFITNESGNAVITGPTLRDDVDSTDQTFTLNVTLSGVIVASQVITITPLPEVNLPAPAPEKLYYVDFVFTNYNPITTIPGTSTNGYVSSFKDGEVVYPFRQALPINAALDLTYKDIPEGTSLRLGLKAIGDDSILTTIFGGGCPTYDSPATIVVGSERNERVFYFNNSTNPYNLSILNAPSEDQSISVKIWDPLNPADAFKVKSFIITKTPAVPSVTGTFLPVSEVNSFGTTILNEEINLGFQVFIRNPPNEVGKTVDVHRYENGKMVGSTAIARTLGGADKDWLIEFNNTTNVPTTYNQSPNSVAAGTQYPLNFNRKFVYSFSAPGLAIDNLGGTIKLYHTSDLITPQKSITTSMSGTSAPSARKLVNLNLAYILPADPNYGSLFLKLWFWTNGHAICNLMQQTDTIEGFPIYETLSTKTIKWDSEGSSSLDLTSLISSGGNAFRQISKSPEVITDISRSKSAASASLIAKPTRYTFNITNTNNQVEYTWPLEPYSGTTSRSIKFSDTILFNPAIWVENKLSIIGTISIAPPKVTTTSSGGGGQFDNVPGSTALD